MTNTTTFADLLAAANEPETGRSPPTIRSTAKAPPARFSGASCFGNLVGLEGGSGVLSFSRNFLNHQPAAELLKS